MSDKYGGGSKYSSGSGSGSSGGKKPNDNKKPDQASGSSGSSRSQDKDLQKRLDMHEKYLPRTSDKYARDLSNEIGKVLKDREKENKK
jgi:hypothetical protein